MSKSSILKTSIARKMAMALSALFLLIFLLQHFAINITSVFRADTFNELSHFMGTNPIVQYVFQPILIFGVIFHFTMGFILEVRNKQSRDIRYVKYNGNANASWFSRNMIWSGLAILAFLGLHFVDFWVPEINTKFIEGNWEGTMAGIEGLRYHTELVHKFENPVRVAAYCIAFVFLAMHLLHGFTSSFQSLGANNKYTRGALRKFAVAYSILIPAGFIIIALYHHFNIH